MDLIESYWLYASIIICLCGSILSLYWIKTKLSGLNRILRYFLKSTCLGHRGFTISRFQNVTFPRLEKLIQKKSLLFVPLLIFGLMS